MGLVPKSPRMALSHFLAVRLRFPNAQQPEFRLPITVPNLGTRIGRVSKFKVVMNLYNSRNKPWSLLKGHVQLYKYDAKQRQETI